MGAEKSNSFPPPVALVPASVITIHPDNNLQQQRCYVDGNNRSVEVGVGRSLHVDLEHFKTPAGIVKLIQFILGMVVIYTPTVIWLNVVADFCCFVTSFWLFVYLFRWNQRFESSIPWSKFELYYLIGATSAYILASLLALVFDITSAVVGILTTAAYAYGAHLVFGTYCKSLTEM